MTPLHFPAQPRADSEVTNSSTPPEYSDLDLVHALQAGDDRALSALMDRHREGLYRFVYRQIPNEADAVELTMEAFVRAYFNIGKFQPTAKFTTWLYHIALNLCRDQLKSRAHQYSLQTVSFDAPTQEDGEPRQIGSSERRPDQRADQLEEFAALDKAIGELPEDLRIPFILTALESRSQAETAEILGLSVKAVGMRVYRARKLLLERMTRLGF